MDYCLEVWIMTIGIGALETMVKKIDIGWDENEMNYWNYTNLSAIVIYITFTLFIVTLLSSFLLATFQSLCPIVFFRCL